MNWFLSLFPQYREIQQLLREEADRTVKFQDQNDALIKQNSMLLHRLQVAESDKDQAIKSVANVFAQLNGHIPPYGEAYKIEKQPNAETGPVPTNRMHARDAVREGRSQFLRDIGVANETVETA